MLPIRGQLIDRGDAMLEVDAYFGYPLHRLIPLRSADTDRFAASELQAVDQVVDALRGKSAEEVSTLSHRDKGWELVAMHEDIPFATAYLGQEAVLTESVRHHAEQLADQLGIRR